MERPSGLIDICAAGSLTKTIIGSWLQERCALQLCTREFGARRMCKRFPYENFSRLTCKKHMELERFHALNFKSFSFHSITLISHMKTESLHLRKNLFCQWNDMVQNFTCEILVYKTSISHASVYIKRKVHEHQFHLWNFHLTSGLKTFSCVDGMWIFLRAVKLERSQGYGLDPRPWLYEKHFLKTWTRGTFSCSVPQDHS